MPKLSSLIVDFQTNTASLKTGLDQANGYLKSFGDKAAGLGKMMKNAFGIALAKEAVVGLGKFVMHGAEVADQMGKMAQATGAPVQELSKLNYAAKLSDVSTESLGGAMRKLNANMVAAASGGKEQSAMFKALGVSVKDSHGNLKTVDVVMRELADKFSDYQDGTAKSAMATEFFGKAGSELIPMLNAGADGLNEMGIEAANLGVVITAEAAASAEQFNDNLTKMKTAGEGIAIQLAAELTPALTYFTEEILKSQEASDFFNGAITVMSGVLKTLFSIGTIGAHIFKTIAVSLTGVAAAVIELLKGNFAGAKEVMSGLDDEMKKGGKGVVDSLSAIWSGEGPMTKGLDKDKKGAKKKMDGILKHAEDLKKNLQITMMATDPSMLRNGAIAAGGGGMNGVSTNVRGWSAPDVDIRRGEQNRMGRATSTASAGRMAVADAVDRLSKAADTAARALADNFASKLGKLGELFEAAKGELATGVADMLQGAGMGAGAGGIIGAVVGVVASMLGDSEGFMGVIEMVSAVIQKAGDALGLFLVPVQRVAAALMPLASALKDFLRPFAGLIQFVSEVLVPPLVMLGMLFQAMAPIMNMMAVALGSCFTIIVASTLPVLQILFEAFRWLGIGILEFTKMITPLWNSIVGAVGSVLRTISNFKVEVLGATIQPFASLGNLATQIEGTSMSVEGLQTQIDTMKGLTWEQANVLADNIRAQTLQTEAIDKATSAMLNVPSGFKVALRRWQSTMDGKLSGSNIQNVRAFASGGVVSRAQLALVGEGGEREVITPESMMRKFFREEVGGHGSVTVNVYGDRDPKETAREVVRLIKRDNLRRGRGPAF